MSDLIINFYLPADLYPSVKVPAMTNGDRIRQMSNEELAKMIECPLGACTHPADDVWCPECILNWLNAPAESEGDK